MAAKDLHPLILRHDDGKRTAVSHASRILAAVLQDLEHAWQAARLDQFEPLGQSIFGVHRVLWIGKPLLGPGEDQTESDWLTPQDRRDDLMHLAAAFFDHLVPVHSMRLDHPPWQCAIIAALLERTSSSLESKGPRMSGRRERGLCRVPSCPAPSAA